ncbi:MAG: DUF975 family protein [Oscillospiraceae bacterium]|nr:DUF975 family protein [Oscillospiraceae bacterium]
MKTCRNCGGMVPDNASFCQKCGAPVENNAMNGTGFVFNDQYNGQGNNYGGNNMNYSSQPMRPGFFDRVLMKSNARLFYKNNTGACIGVSLISLGITIVPTLLSTGAMDLADSLDDTAFAGSIMGFISLILYFAALAVSLLVQFATCSWYRKAIYSPLQAGDLIREGMDDTVGKLCTGLLMALKTFLWTLLFYIPGIIKAYQYSMTPYIKSENPRIGASRAIELSGIITNGHKWDLFVMDLSFYGWFILSGLTMNILGVIYVIPYYNSAKAFAYEDLKAQAIAMGKINPMELDPYAG